MANEVVLTFAGDTGKAEQAFDRVGGAAREMEGEVRQAGDGFDRVGEAADNVDTRAMGFRDTLTGLQDGFAGIKAVNEGGLGFESLLLLGFGIGDLASGMFNFLIPSLKSATLWLRNTRVGVIATAAAKRVAAVATHAFAAAMRVLNLVMRMNPIGLIITAVIALIGIVIAIEKRTGFFSRAWRVAWAGITRAAQATWNWLRGLPGRIGSAFSSIAGRITSPFRSAFNSIANLWNRTIGAISVTIPSWVPGLGGNSFSAPSIPTFHGGGQAGGARGREFLAVLQAGERVVHAGGAGGAAPTLVIQSGGSRLDDALVELLRRAVAIRGGNVQTVLGASRG